MIELREWSRLAEELQPERVRLSNRIRQQLWRLRYKLSLRDLPEMFAIRGLVFSYEAVREWEAKLTPALAEALRRGRRGTVGRSWSVDET